MIAKGLHFPNVTLVGVVFADTALHMPDFRAGERTFQLLTQVAGRAGRGDVAGEVIVQTFTPFHPAIQAARRMDFEGFADQELAFRRELEYPPFTHLVCILVKGPSEDAVRLSARTLGKALREAYPEAVRIDGPAPAPLAKAKGLYRYQLMLRARSTRTLVAPLKELIKGFKWPAKVTCQVDVDALSIL
jgi:primosomal protein N' (replication factor Y)